MTSEWHRCDETQEGQNKCAGSRMQPGMDYSLRDAPWDGLQPMGCTLECDMDAWGQRGGRQRLRGRTKGMGRGGWRWDTCVRVGVCMLSGVLMCICMVLEQ